MAEDDPDNSGRTISPATPNRIKPSRTRPPRIGRRTGGAAAGRPGALLPGRSAPDPVRQGQVSFRWNPDTPREAEKIS